METDKKANDLDVETVNEYVVPEDDGPGIYANADSHQDDVLPELKTPIPTVRTAKAAPTRKRDEADISSSSGAGTSSSKKKADVLRLKAKVAKKRADVHEAEAAAARAILPARALKRTFGLAAGLAC